MKRKLTAADFAVGDVVLWGGHRQDDVIAIVKRIQLKSGFWSQGKPTGAIWCRSVTEDNDICRWDWWDGPDSLTILASPLALAKQFCGYEEPKEQA